MKHKSIIKSPAFIISVLCTISLGVLCFVLRDKNNTSFTYWIPLISVCLTCLINALTSHETYINQLEAEERYSLPEIIFENRGEWTPAVDERFPWGGDPEPAGVYPFFLPERETKESDCKVSYLEASIKNIGKGNARNIRVIMKESGESSKIIPFLIANEPNNHKFYFQITYATDIDELVYEFAIEFESMSGKKYQEQLTCNIMIYDMVINNVTWNAHVPIVL